MTTNWYIARNNQKFGPFSTNQLQQLANLGLVKSTEHVLEEGANKWVAVTSIEGIFPASASANRYWLSLNGQSQGPYSAEQIRVGLACRRLPPETLSCPEDGRQWTALAQVADFQAFIPASPRDSHARLGLGSSHLDLSEEEAEVHLAGKKGDMIAKLVSTLLDMRRKYRSNASMVEIIEKNIQDLKAIRAKGLSEIGCVRAPRRDRGARVTPRSRSGL
jgi:hypothetical protein